MTFVLPGRAARGRRLSAALIAVGVLVAGVAETTSAQPSLSRAAASLLPSDPDDRDPLTPEQVRSQVAAAARLEAQLASSNKAVAAAQAKLAALAARSSALMNQVAAAKGAEVKARQAESREVAALRELVRQALDARTDVEQMAYQAYVHGSGTMSDVRAVLELASTGDSGPASAALVDYLAEARAADGRKYESLAAAQQAVVKRVAAARQAREAATAKAEQAQAKAAAAVSSQRAALAELTALAAAQRSQLDGVRERVGATPASFAALETGALCSADTGTYPNGRLPASALCPVGAGGGDLMRPAAARALNALAIAYRDHFKTDLCITDTYRSYEEQVAVKQRRGRWAATPGTSQHGLGLAVDLCGGIENFGTEQYRWMTRHAALFGFYHPDWAEPGGSLPEPWHWEYGS